MSGKFYSRRGFMGLTVAAGAGLGLSACTGAAPSTSGAGSSAPAPTSNELRVFTYEDKATIDLLKAQIKLFDQQAGTVTTVDSLPGSGAAVYPDKLKTELLGGSDRVLAERELVELPDPLPMVDLLGQAHGRTVAVGGVAVLVRREVPNTGTEDGKVTHG